MRLQRFAKKTIEQTSTTIATLAVVVLIFLTSCQEKQFNAPAIECRDSLAVMSTYGVSTLISDSGRISYKIDAEEPEQADRFYVLPQHRQQLH